MTATSIGTIIPDTAFFRASGHYTCSARLLASSGFLHKDIGHRHGNDYSLRANRIPLASVHLSARFGHVRGSAPARQKAVVKPVTAQKSCFLGRIGWFLFQPRRHAWPGCPLVVHCSSSWRSGLSSGSAACLRLVSWGFKVLFSKRGPLCSRSLLLNGRKAGLFMCRKLSWALFWRRCCFFNHAIIALRGLPKRGRYSSHFLCV